MDVKRIDNMQFMGEAGTGSLPFGFPQCKFLNFFLATQKFH